MCEIGMVLSELGYLLRRTRRYCRDTHVLTPLAQFPAKSFVSPEPYGVALIISPWNYPVLLSFEPMADAIAAGNCVCMKPSELSPHTSGVMADLIAAGDARAARAARRSLDEIGRAHV